MRQVHLQERTLAASGNTGPGESSVLSQPRATRPLVAYLLGTSYCGSTLVSILAGMHPRVTSVGEIAPNRAVRRRGMEDFKCSCLNRIAECPFWSEVFQRVQAEGFDFSAENWSNDYRYVSPVMHRLFDHYPHHRVERAVQRFAQIVMPSHGRHVCRTNLVTSAFVRAALAADGSDVLFDATKSVSRLAYLLEVPDLEVRVIRLVRDVRAFVRSKQRKGEGAVAASREWLTTREAEDIVLAQIPAGKTLTIQYERLAADCNAEMGHVFEHLGLDPYRIPDEIDPRKVHVLGNSMRLKGPIRVQINERWRDELSQRDTETALRIAGTYNASLGYS